MLRLCGRVEGVRGGSVWHTLMGQGMIGEEVRDSPSRERESAPSGSRRKMTTTARPGRTSWPSETQRMPERKPGPSNIREEGSGVTNSA